MAELAYGIAETILEKLASKANEEISLARSVKNELRKLEKTIRHLKLKLEDAEKKQYQNEELRIWLVDLKDLLNDAVDVLDEFDCEELRCQVVKEFGSVARKVRRFCSSSNPLAFRFRIAHRVKRINERFDEITKDMAKFRLISSQLKVHEEQSHVSDRMTHSFVKASEVIGRDEDKAEIIKRLMSHDGSDGDNNLSIIPIVGLGGLGKTTLAQSVFNDERVEERFELKLWVCVSLDFDVTRVLREVVKSAQQDPSGLSLDQLQNTVRATLTGKRFLLILDDVWNEDRDKWVDLKKFLTEGAEGSKVIVTTRSKKVCEKMTIASQHVLQGLSKEDSLSLFFRWSFGDEKRAGQDLQLEEIGKAIVERCGGVPLALRTLGSLLHSEPIPKWISIRDSELWEIDQKDDDILPALRLSYNAMSSCLKQCFAYSSIFHEDEVIIGFDFILFWMALGILQSHNDKMELEEVGFLQLKELCHRSFLQVEEECKHNEEFNGYTMHDLIYDLAHSINIAECYKVKTGREDTKDKTILRYLRLSSDQISETIVESSKKLWSIHTDAEEKNISESTLSMCIKHLRYLRLFDLSRLSFEVLPSSIGILRHLRQLDLSHNSTIKKLPNSVCKLQSLQSLLLNGCKELEELPRDMRKMVSLRILFVTTKQTYFPEGGIGHLKSLRWLDIQDCMNLKSLPSDMNSCSTLRHLFISYCPELDLTSGGDVAIRLSLQRFFICQLPQTIALPQWLKGASHSLKSLHIEECRNLVKLPEWLPDSTALEKLLTKGCPEILTWPNGTQRLISLTHFEIRECAKLELGSKHEKHDQLKLKKFIIYRLHRTTALPSWLQGASQTLEYLQISNCTDLSALPEWLSDLSSLRKLVIEYCPKLTTLPEGMARLTSLKDLEIENCSSAFQKRYEREIGVDREIIAHVPNVQIGRSFDW